MSPQAERTIILEPHKIQQKLERMAYEICEQNYNEPELILAGINVKGLFLAKRLASLLQTITDIPITVLNLRLDPRDPAHSPVEIDIDESINGKTVIIMDDVANTGRTLLFGMKPFLDYLPKKIQVAVLVDRQHKQYPISSDFVGLSLSTTLQEHIEVDVQGDQFKSIYLE